IGAAGVILRVPELFVAYLTDGAPRDPGLWPPQVISREHYVQIRREETRAALQIASVPFENILNLSAVDQESMLRVFPLTLCFKWLLEEIAQAGVRTSA